MSHKRRGQITVSGEWAKHLRPFLRRVFWKKERQAAHVHVRSEAAGNLQPSQPSSGTLEALLASIEALPVSAESIVLWVPENLTFEAQEIHAAVAMAIVTDKLLARGLYPSGVASAPGGKQHQYSKE